MFPCWNFTSITCISIGYFFYYSQDFSLIIRVLLSHQSLIDATTYLWATPLLLQPPNWVPGISILDDVVCHAWTGQFIYWCSVLISGQYSLLYIVNVLVTFTHLMSVYLSHRSLESGDNSGGALSGCLSAF